jgi:hypothetical protein
MAFTSRVFRVLVASPSDVDEEREIAVRVIQQWNDLYSHARLTTLLPLRWETHTAPEYNTRPQEVVNRSIVNDCDLLVGIFWTRIGTPTGDAPSGTLEEIDRVAKAGKPVMLYFSKVGADPDAVDPNQLAQLKAFREKTYPNALTETYKSHIDFRDKLFRQLELQVRELQKRDEAGQTPALHLGFASEDSRRLESSKLERSARLITVSDAGTALQNEPSDVQDFLRATIARRVRRAATLPVLLGVRNAGSQGIRNLYVDMKIHADGASIDVSDASAPRPVFQDTWPSLYTFNFEVADDDSLQAGPWDGDLEVDDGDWKLGFEWDALQPQRVRFIRPPLALYVTGDCIVEFTAHVFADSFPEPLMLRAMLQVTAEPHTIQLADILPDVDALKRQHNKPGSFITYAKAAQRGLLGK